MDHIDGDSNAARVQGLFRLGPHLTELIFRGAIMQIALKPHYGHP